MVLENLIMSARTTIDEGFPPLSSPYHRRLTDEEVVKLVHGLQQIAPLTTASTALQGKPVCYLSLGITTDACTVQLASSRFSFTIVVSHVYLERSRARLILWRSFTFQRRGTHRCSYLDARVNT